MSARARAKPPGAYHHGDLRRALVTAATRVVSEQGAEGLRLRELARELGVSHRAVYRHFADREALVLEVALEGWRALAAGLERAGEGSDAPVRAMLGAYVRFALAHGGHYRCMVGPGSAAFRADSPLARAVLGTIRIVEREVVAQTGQSGRPARDRVFAIWGMAHGLCDLVLCGHARAASRSKAEAWILGLAEPLLVDAGLR